jgi:hypothetical protein
MKKIIALGAVTLASFTTQAEVRINGFANLVAGMTTSSDDSLYGYDDNVSFNEDSLFAIQVSGDINSKMTATGQLVARGSNDYSPDFEWAYITYEATDNVNISAGRLRLPLFSYSASKDVGYSYHWLATPEVVYNVPFNNLDGIRVDYSTYAGDWEYNASLSAGTFSGDAYGTQVQGQNVIVLSAEATYDWFKMRAVAGRGKTSIDLGKSTQSDVIGLNDGLTLMSNPAYGFADLANDLLLEDNTGRFLGLSTQIDKFDWFVSAEITSVDVEDSFLAKTVAYYISAGIRSGAWTPSVTYEKSKTDDALKFQDKIGRIATSPLPVELKQGFTAIAVGSQLFSQSEYNVLSATVRYDFDTNVAFKADVSKYSDDLDDTMDATLVRFAVNYVF